MDPNLVQQSFFNLIKSKLPAHFSFVDEIALILNISNDSAYRRIRGEKPISLDELHLLSSKFQVSIDQLFQLQNSTFSFSGNLVSPKSYDFDTYVKDVAKNLAIFKSLDNPHLYFYNKDIPLFHFMPFPELCAFKFFFWKRTVIGYPEMAKQQFNGTEENVEIVASAKNIIQLYNQIPSTEIWNEESVHCTIKQIEFYRQSNVFADKTVLVKVYAQLVELLNHIEGQAEIGRKILYGQPISPNPASYDLYINEFLLGDNFILVEAIGRRIASVNHNGLNFLITQDITFCDYAFKHLQNIIRKSTHISRSGEKDRSMFFNTLRDKIHEKMKALI